MTGPLIDAELGPFEERIHREASEEFWRYVAASALVGAGSMVDYAARITGLAKAQLRHLATLHWMLSDELAQFLEALPSVLSRLSRTTSPLAGEGQEVRGAIDWGLTTALRATTGWSLPVFAYVEAQAENDTAANRVLKTTLQWTVAAATTLVRHVDELADERIEAERWVQEANRRGAVALRALQHPGLSMVRAPQRLSEHDLRSCATEAARGYRRAVASARLRRRLIEREDRAELHAMIRRRVLVPAQKFRLFEIWILARVARFFRENGCDELSVPLLGDLQSVPVYRFRKNGIATIDVFFQGIPVVMRRMSAYKQIFDAYDDLDVSSRTPDIIIQRGARSDSLRVMIEAKASSDPRYIADGAYKVLGYAADFANALPAASSMRPVALLVTKTRPQLRPGADRSGHAVWIANIESLDSSLATLLRDFVE